MPGAHGMGTMNMTGTITGAMPGQMHHAPSTGAMAAGRVTELGHAVVENAENIPEVGMSVGMGCPDDIGDG